MRQLQDVKEGSSIKQKCKSSYMNWGIRSGEDTPNPCRSSQCNIFMVGIGSVGRVLESFPIAISSAEIKRSSSRYSIFFLSEIDQKAG